MLSNHRPVVSSEDGALWDRLKVMPFDKTVPPEQRDEAVKQTLEHDPQARAALLAWGRARQRGCG
jgi:phage/plasmid-associated DNA primase